MPAIASELCFVGSWTDVVQIRSQKLWPIRCMPTSDHLRWAWVVDDTGAVTNTNDGATILRLLKIDHPASKVHCKLAKLQGVTFGDRTISIAAKLLKNLNYFVK
uniref:T-complex protein 1 subunit alpha n=1 Tax=Culex pipiens TaxID=7175 RepID=A0A8D8DMD8_CULPI